MHVGLQIHTGCQMLDPAAPSTSGPHLRLPDPGVGEAAAEHHEVAPPPRPGPRLAPPPRGQHSLGRGLRRARDVVRQRRGHLGHNRY